MSDEKEIRNAQRRAGRALACEGLLASRFGQRTSHAGIRAIQHLRDQQQTETAGTPLVVARFWGRQPIPATTAAWSLHSLSEACTSAFRARPAAWLALAASVALLIGGLFHRLTMTAATSAMLEVKGPGVVIERGRKLLSARIGMPLRVGDFLTVPPDAQAFIALPQNSLRIALSGGSRLRLGKSPTGEPWELTRGKIEVVADSRSAAAPMRFLTPQAEARVSGTHFVLAARQTSTWLQVLEGTVRLSQLGSIQTAITVSPHQCAMVAPNVELAAQPDDQRWQTPYLAIRTPVSKKGS